MPYCHVRILFVVHKFSSVISESGSEHTHPRSSLSFGQRLQESSWIANFSYLVAKSQVLLLLLRPFFFFSESKSKWRMFFTVGGGSRQRSSQSIIEYRLPRCQLHYWHQVTFRPFDVSELHSTYLTACIFFAKATPCSKEMGVFPFSIKHLEGKVTLEYLSILQSALRLPLSHIWFQPWQFSTKRSKRYQDGRNSRAMVSNLRIPLSCDILEWGVGNNWKTKKENNPFEDKKEAVIGHSPLVQLKKPI